jgi:tetratricopeptide (TPR) repeat protein
VVALRAYSNPVEAAIAKSLLDNHNIFCRLADENVNLLGGGPLAMPIRLLVAEDQVEEAARILETKGPGLSEDFDVGVDPSLSKEPLDVNEQILSELHEFHATNRWILLLSITVLVLAVYLVYQIPRHISPWSAVYQAMRQYDYARAAELTQKIVRQHPDDYYGHEYLGDIYFKMGNLNQAESEYSRALNLSLPHSLQQKLEQVRERRERESRVGPTATPIPWPR